MIDHVSIAVRDLRAAGAFYDAVLAPIALSRLVTRERRLGLGSDIRSSGLTAGRIVYRALIILAHIFACARMRFMGR
jgi:catechol 2,3-dioxygenase-like lactoylglutathione lyase family enzyme